MILPYILNSNALPLMSHCGGRLAGVLWQTAYFYMPAVDEYPPALIYGSQVLAPVGHRIRNLHLGDHVDTSSTVKDKVELRSTGGGGGGWSTAVAA